jgi:hypothetical protein
MKKQCCSLSKKGKKNSLYIPVVIVIRTKTQISLLSAHSFCSTIDAKMCFSRTPTKLRFIINRLVVAQTFKFIRNVSALRNNAFYLYQFSRQFTKIVKSVCSEETLIGITPQYIIFL